jgi:hypothetical protein
MALRFEKIQTKSNPKGEDKFGMCFWVHGNRMAFDYL